MSRPPNVAVVGAGGLVGRELVEILGEREFPLGDLRLFGTERSAGESLTCGQRRGRIEVLREGAFEGTDIVFLATSAAVSQEQAPRARAAGATVIDLSSAFRLDPSAALVVPEVNADVLRNHRGWKVVAGPSGVVVPLVVVLSPLRQAAGLRRVVVATYQAASGAGREGMEELARQTVRLLNAEGGGKEELAGQLAFNCLPQVDEVTPEGWTLEEERIARETRKILGQEDLGLSVTAVRVPTFYGHALAVNVELERPLDASQAAEILRAAPGIVSTEEAAMRAPTPAGVAGSDATFVGRLRSDPSVPSGLSLWVVADNVRKGAALNAVATAEIVLREEAWCR